MSTSPDGVDRASVWSIFEQSRVPMALVDDRRRYVKVNAAALELFRYARENVIGAVAARTARDEDPTTGEAQWAELVRSNECYGERVVEDANGAPVRVSFAAHAMFLRGQWFAIIVALSAHLEPGGTELIRIVEPETSSTSGRLLTRRECEIVRRVALGHQTREIAAELYLSPATVSTHIRNAMIKTSAHTRAQLVAIALSAGLISE